MSPNVDEPQMLSSATEKQDGRRSSARLAREEVLDSMKTDEQAETLRRAERLGPGMDDPDWLIASAALRVEKAVDLAVNRIEEVASTIAAAVSGGNSELRAQNGKTLFEQCLDLCSSIAERERLKSLAIRLHLSENAPAWAIVMLHAESRAIFGLRSTVPPVEHESWRAKLSRLISD